MFLYLWLTHICKIRKHLLDELRNETVFDRTRSSDITDENYKDRLTSLHNQLYDYFESATTADMFDYLSKELIRLQAEQVLYLFVLLADRYRYQREVTETICRARTIEHNMLEDYAFREVTGVQK